MSIGSDDDVGVPCSKNQNKRAANIDALAEILDNDKSAS